MIQFNLLPDVKLEYIKARRTKRLVILASAITTAVSVLVAVILFIGTSVVQRQHLDHLREDINKYSQELKDEKDLNKILTVQHQLDSLTGLHQAKPATERLGTYMSQTTPLEVTISDLTVDFSTNTMRIEGAAQQFRPINEFIDTLKFTKYNLDGNSANAFHSVVLTAFTRNDEDPKPASFEINLSFDPVIFDNTKFDKTKPVTLEVPVGTTTRSTTERPATPLFQIQEDDTDGGEE